MNNEKKTFWASKFALKPKIFFRRPGTRNKCPTHWGRDKIADFWQTTYKYNFLNENVWIFIKFYWGQIDNKTALVQIIAWRQIGDKPLSEPTRKIRTPPFWDTPRRLKLNLTSRVYHERTGLKSWPKVRPCRVWLWSEKNWRRQQK